jgi:hypothetical protein
VVLEVMVEPGDELEREVRVVVVADQPVVTTTCARPMTSGPRTSYGADVAHSVGTSPYTHEFLRTSTSDVPEDAIIELLARRAAGGGHRRAVTE